MSDIEKTESVPAVGIRTENDLKNAVTLTDERDRLEIALQRLDALNFTTGVWVSDTSNPSWNGNPIHLPSTVVWDMRNGLSERLFEIMTSLEVSYGIPQNQFRMTQLRTFHDNL